MSENKHGRGLGPRGYTVALIAFAAVVGMIGYAAFSGGDAQTQEGADAQVLASAPVADQSGTVLTGEPEDTASASEPQPSASTRLSARMPVEGQVISEYAMEVLSYNQTTRDWRVHSGVDIAAASGTPVLAAADGTVYTVYDDASMGMTVVIRHENGYETSYASLSGSVSVSAGDSVTVGQAIGTVGSTALMENALGDHVHFAVTCNGESVDPMEFVG